MYASQTWHKALFRTMCTSSLKAQLYGSNFGAEIATQYLNSSLIGWINVIGMQ